MGTTRSMYEQNAINQHRYVIFFRSQGILDNYTN